MGKNYQQQQLKWVALQLHTATNSLQGIHFFTEFIPSCFLISASWWWLKALPALIIEEQ